MGAASGSRLHRPIPALYLLIFTTHCFMFKLIIGLTFVASLVAGVYYGSPYYTLYEARSALVGRDSTTFNTFVDYPRVQASVKNQLNAKLSEKLIGNAAGKQIGTKVIDTLVKKAITPQRLPQILLKGDFSNLDGVLPAMSKADAGKNAPEPLSWDVKFGANTVVVNVYKASEGERDTAQEIAFVFERLEPLSLTWTMSAIKLPLDF